MSFIKPIIIYQNKNTEVYINQCHAKGRKTNIYAIRRNDYTGYADLLGVIQWSGRWRQYVLMSKKNTQWSSGCMDNISKFMQDINKKHRMRLRK